MVPRILRLVSQSIFDLMMWFFLVFYVLFNVWQNVFNVWQNGIYNSFTIFFQVLFIMNPFEIEWYKNYCSGERYVAHGLLVLLNFQNWTYFAVCFTYDSVKDIRAIAKILKKSLIIGIYLLKQQPLKQSLKRSMVKV